MNYFSTILAFGLFLGCVLACGGGSTSTTTTSTSSSPGTTTTSTTTSTSDSGSSATVSSVTLKNNSDTTVTSFKPSDNPQKFEVQMSQFNAGRVKGVFTAVDAEGSKNTKILEKEIELGKFTNLATFTMSLPRDFPKGEYKLDVYVNDKLVKTHEYEVE